MNRNGRQERQVTKPAFSITANWILLLLVGFVISTSLLATDRLVIAHRGGVVDRHRSENSLSALAEAIRRGYTHVEVDARITADGHVVCFHNDSLREETGMEGRISTKTLEEIIKIKLTRSGETIPTFEQYVARCAGRIGVMVDLKGCAEKFIEPYANEIIEALTKHRLLTSALILINKTPKNNQDKIIPHFLGKSRVSWRHSLAETQKIRDQVPNLGQDYYVFNHGADFDQTEVRGFQALGLQVIVSINTQHYAREDALAEGLRHIEAMTSYGVDGLQIDSVYDSVAFQK